MEDYDIGGDGILCKWRRLRRSWRIVIKEEI